MQAQHAWWVHTAIKHKYSLWSLLFTLMTHIHFIYLQIINSQINLKTKAEHEYYYGEKNGSHGSGRHK
jgi:hypothetical protein